MGCFNSTKAHLTWRLASKGTEPSESAPGSMAMWRHSGWFALWIWQFFYYNSLKPLLTKFFWQFIKHYCHRMIASYLLAAVEKFPYPKTKDGIIPVPCIQPEGGIGVNGNSWGCWIPSPSHFLQKRNIQRKNSLFEEKKKPSWMSLFDIIVILNKFRDMISSDLALPPLAIFNGPSVTRQWFVFPLPGHPRLMPNTCAEKKAPKPWSYSSAMWHWIFSNIF